MGLSICKGCNNKFDTETMTIVKKKKYCSECYAKLSKEEPVKKEQFYKCTDCGKYVSSEDRQLHNGKSYCMPCLTKRMKEKQTYKKLMDFIWEEQGHNQGRIIVSTKNVKSFHEEYGYSYNGIYLTLKYMIKYRNIDIRESIGLVPYYFDEAKKFYKECHEIAVDTMRNTAPIQPRRYISGVKQPEHKPNLGLPTMSVADLEV